MLNYSNQSPVKMKNVYIKFFFSVLAIITSFNLLAQMPVYFDPPSCEATLNPNDSIGVYSVLKNATNDTVEFSFPGYTSRDLGGPDSFGYSWIDSDEEGGPGYEWNDIAETGTLIEGLGDDNVVGPFEMNIFFPYYGQSKHLFWISSNGAISFNDQFLTFANEPIPTNSNYIDFIAWFWDDLKMDSALSRVYYKNFENKTILQFTKMVHYPGSDATITAQVIMVNTGAIFIRYKQISEGFETNSSTVGLQSWNPAMGLQVSYNQEYLHSEMAIRFDLNRNFIVRVHPSSLYLPPNSQEHIWITYSSVSYDPGTYEQELKCVTSLPEVPQIYLHNVMHVNTPAQAGFEGYVTNAVTGLPINDVRVQAGDHYVYTNGNGHYELALNQGSYNVQFTREGYHTLIVEDTAAVVGFSILDAELQPIENYLLTGRVYAGDNYIETGFAYGYKMHEGNVVDIYAEMVNAEGRYTFTGLSSAQYIVKAEPSPNSMYYGNFLPTYYGDVLHWEDATVINLTQSTDGAHIHLVAVTNAPEGNGSISGMISGERSANIAIVLKATETGTASMTYSSTDGSFVFSNLSFGNYEVFAEIPGKSITPRSVVLDEVNPTAEGIDMMILENEIVFLGIAESDIFKTVPFIYPNPVKDKINVNINLKKSSRVKIEISDLAGRIFNTEDYDITGQKTITIDSKELSKGIYLLRCASGNEVMVNKFIK
jgi:hypothetical protein